MHSTSGVFWQSTWLTRLHLDRGCNVHTYELLPWQPVHKWYY